MNTWALRALAVLAGSGAGYAGWRLLAGWTSGDSYTGAGDDMGGWGMKPGVVLPAGAEPWLDQLADRSGVRFTVTSGVRTAAEQARAMQAKRDRQLAGSTAESDDLLALYADDEAIQILLANPYSAWATLIQAWADRGRYLSRHLTGRAVDIRIKDLSTEQRAALERATMDLSGRALMESDHLHIDIPSEV